MSSCHLINYCRSVYEKFVFLFKLFLRNEHQNINCSKLKLISIAIGAKGGKNAPQLPILFLNRKANNKRLNTINNSCSWNNLLSDSRNEHNFFSFFPFGAFLRIICICLDTWRWMVWEERKMILIQIIPPGIFVVDAQFKCGFICFHYLRC